MRATRLAAFVIWATIALAACQKHPRVAALPVPPAPPRALAALERADLAFNAGSYNDAIPAYESCLQLSPSPSQREQALFRLGLAYVLRSAPVPDWKRAATFLKQLVQEYPGSPLQAQANLILSLRSELDQLAVDSRARDQRIRQLSTELDKLKKIDTERRARP